MPYYKIPYRALRCCGTLRDGCYAVICYAMVYNITRCYMVIHHNIVLGELLPSSLPLARVRGGLFCSGQITAPVAMTTARQSLEK